MEIHVRVRARESGSPTSGTQFEGCTPTTTSSPLQSGTLCRGHGMVRSPVDSMSEEISEPGRRHPLDDSARNRESGTAQLHVSLGFDAARDCRLWTVDALRALWSHCFVHRSPAPGARSRSPRTRATYTLVSSNTRPSGHSTHAFGAC